MASPAGRHSDEIASAILLAIPCWLFRAHLRGDSVYLGNPDRLNSHLKMLKHQADSLAAGGVGAWCSGEMAGYDSFTLPHTFLHPLGWLSALAPPGELYVLAGAVSLALLALSGVLAYVALRAYVKSPLACLAGAAVCQLCELSVLKVSQNDLTFTVLLAIPIGLLALRRLQGARPERTFWALCAVVIGLLELMFLQTAAYALLLLGAYSVYRSVRVRSALPVVVFGCASAVGLTVAAPRLLGVAEAMGRYVRQSAGRDLTTFDAVYEFQNIRPYEILRWLDGAVFGHTSAELGNNINLSEGFLLFSGAAATWVVFAAVGAWLLRAAARRSADPDVPFFVATLLACISVVVCKPVLHIVYEAFLGMDFTHARVLVIAVFPFAALVAFAVNGLGAGAITRSSLLGLCAGAAVGWLCAAAAAQSGAHVELFGLTARVDGLVWAGVTLFVIGMACDLARILPGVGRTVSAAAVAGVILGQAVAGAEDRIDGATAGPAQAPFRDGALYAAPGGDFSPPSEIAVAQLGDRLESRRYRSVMICEPTSAGGLCAGHMASFWRLRLADGYYGLGVPRRLAALHWPDGVGLRSISFTDPTRLPWQLLALLNVKYAMLVDYAWYANHGSPEAADARVIENPYDPTPRAFFPERIALAESLTEAAAHLSESCESVTQVSWVEAAEADVAVLLDPTRERRPATSLVRSMSTPSISASAALAPEIADRAFAQSAVADLPAARCDVSRAQPSQLAAITLAASSPIELEEHPDRLDVRFVAAPRARLLVLNELFAPGWRATADGEAVPILATNAFMRGIVVPALATHVRLSYRPRVLGPRSAIVYMLAAVLFVVGSAGLRRWHRIRERV